MLNLEDTFEMTVTRKPLTAMAAMNEHFAKVLQDVPDAAIVFNSDGLILFVNHLAERLLGYALSEFTGLPVQSLLKPVGESMCLDVFRPDEEQRFTVCDKSGVLRQLDIRCHSLEVPNEHGLIVALMRDVTAYELRLCELQSLVSELEKTTAHLEDLVNSDPLTDLLNRRGLENVLPRELAFAKRKNSELLAALIDLDNFKAVNDTYGHHIGDQVLRNVAETLRRTVRASDWLGRVGGDEFLILLPATSLEEGVKAAERIRLKISEHAISSVAPELRTTASIGLICLPQNLCSVEEVLELAKSSLKASKTGGKNRLSVGNGFDVTTQQTAGYELKELMSRLAEFTTVSQPIFNLNDGGIAGFEFLTRGPSGPLEMPNELFRLAESNHILTLVDLHCLKMSLLLCKSLPPGVIGHINLFPSTLNDLPVERLLNLFDGYTDLDLCIELSARQLLTECERTKERTRALQKLGIAIGLDNVGFGCSSLETLTQLEPDIVKIDSRCVSHLSSNPAKQKSLSTLVSVARLLGARTIGEGIETKEDLAALVALGVTIGQGWLWGKPQ